ncbi:rRNA-processing protein MPP10 [Lachancea thermotolerans CBS 6340]|uniref:U3 small nucleolar ribonucleoprotein protein MPP10 n=1 Tax=Lachancea thermotolerans (strain ATCC 56472 / CBS 6340 / NRRL Y-8284) TaxID=559295 RepID=C5DCG8_LACTC|nr:KLTH0B02948p [Lachancea thermotolerans CBS 6340]CAR21479.1 KLTH0B02948p [Lachancea thermotolerans CBS 6340]
MTSFINKISDNPISIISENEDTSTDSLRLVKTYIDDVILSQKALDGKVLLDEIVVEGLDANQIWQQVRLVLENSGPKLMGKISTIRTSLAEVNESDEEISSSESSEVEENKEEELEGMNEFDSDESEKVDAIITTGQSAGLPINNSDDEYHSEVREGHNSNRGSGDEGSEEEEGGANNSDGAEEITVGPKKDSFGLNDEFFDLEEFNRQTIDNENTAEPDNEINYFEDVPSEEDEEVLYYDDFFDKPSSSKRKVTSGGDKQVKFGEHGEDFHENSDDEYDRAMESAKLDLFAEVEDDEMKPEVDPVSKLSTFQRQQLDIQRQIAQLEKEAVAEKKWALKGEVKAGDRPEDALLTEDLDFERTSKPVPVITSDVTESLEDMIRRRIQQREFDDLARRVEANLNFSSAKPQFELSDSKSSKSLAELYENDYNNIPQDSEVSEELKKSHAEISDLYSKLVYSLDALSSAHFIPKPAQKTLEVRVQTPAINMEDAQPLTMSTAPTLAPQEVYAPGASRSTNEISLKNGVVMSRDELSKDDKNRLRRALKRKRSKRLENQSGLSQKKSKKDSVIQTLSSAKNVTLIDKRGDKRDVKGNIVKDGTTGRKNFKL